MVNLAFKSNPKLILAILTLHVGFLESWSTNLKHHLTCGFLIAQLDTLLPRFKRQKTVPEVLLTKEVGSYLAPWSRWDKTWNTWSLVVVVVVVVVCSLLLFLLLDVGGGGGWMLVLLFILVVPFSLIGNYHYRSYWWFYHTPSSCIIMYH